MKRIFIILCVLGLLFVNMASLYAADDNEGKININKATKEELISAGIDESIAEGIIELREENEEFVDLDELLDVDGVDASLLRQLKKILFIEAAANCNC